jgi:hypothetical protein
MLAKSEREVSLMQGRLNTMKQEVESLQKANKHLLLKHREEEENRASFEERAKVIQKNFDEAERKLKDAERARADAEQKIVSLTSQLMLDFLDTRKHFDCSLNSVGAEGHRFVIDAENFETERFFNWLRSNIGLIPSIVKGMEEYASKISFDAIVQMLEKIGCDHLRQLGSRSQKLPEVEVQTPTRLSTVLSNRLVVEFWQQRGFAEAQRLSLAKLAQVFSYLKKLYLVLNFRDTVDPLTIPCFSNRLVPKLNILSLPGSLSFGETWRRLRCSQVVTKESLLHREPQQRTKV